MPLTAKNALVYLSEGRFCVKKDDLVFDHPLLGRRSIVRNRAQFTFDQQQQTLAREISASLLQAQHEQGQQGQQRQKSRKEYQIVDEDELESVLHECGRARFTTVQFMSRAAPKRRILKIEIAYDTETVFVVSRRLLNSLALVKFFCDPNITKVGFNLARPLLTLLQRIRVRDLNGDVVEPQGFCDLQVLSYKLKIGTTKIASLMDLAKTQNSGFGADALYDLALAFGLPNIELEKLAQVAADRNKHYNEYARQVFQVLYANDA
jgi:hypothetical protein